MYILYSWNSSKFQDKIAKQRQNRPPITHRHDSLLSWLSTITSIKSDGAMLDLCA